MSATQQKYHFIGIGGIGMSALARMVLQNKAKVSGSDAAFNMQIDKLMEMGAHVSIGHSWIDFDPATVVVYSSAIPNDNPEFAAAKQAGCTLLHRSDLLFQLMDRRKALVVSGTHGKTTTSALLMNTLKAAGIDPAYALGGVDVAQGAQSCWGDGTYFVAEGDESDGSFLKTKPYGAILTNLEEDHMEYWKKFTSLQDAFKTFFEQMENPERCLWCGDDPALREILHGGASYGFSPECTVRIKGVRQTGWSLEIDIEDEGVLYPSLKLSLIGRHNALNAAAVFGLARRLGVSEEKIRLGFSAFKGVERRAQKVWEGSRIIIDDYAHHPTEIRATLDAIRAAMPDRRLIAIYQPHRYTRTKDLLGSYKDCFKSADEVLVTEIYLSREKPIEGICSESIVREVAEVSKIPVFSISKVDLIAEVSKRSQQDDVIVTLGAGDITYSSHALACYFAQPVKL